MGAWEYNYVSTIVTTWSAERRIEPKCLNSLWVFKTVYLATPQFQRTLLCIPFWSQKGQVKDQQTGIPSLFLVHKALAFQNAHILTFTIEQK